MARLLEAVRQGLQWGSETGSRRWHRRKDRRDRIDLGGFNGAPRLGLGDGAPGWSDMSNSAVLQWGSETGSRRWPERREVGPYHLRLASMGLRDWVSEMVRRFGPTRTSIGRGFNGAPRLGLGDGQRPNYYGPSLIGALQWGSETGSRRWPAPTSATPTSATRFNGAPRLGLGDGNQRK